MTATVHERSEEYRQIRVRGDDVALQKAEVVTVDQASIELENAFGPPVVGSAGDDARGGKNGCACGQGQGQAAVKNGFHPTCP